MVDVHELISSDSIDLSIVEETNCVKCENRIKELIQNFHQNIQGYPFL